MRSLGLTVLASGLLALFLLSTSPTVAADCAQPIYLEETQGPCAEGQRDSACGCAVPPRLKKQIDPTYPHGPFAAGITCTVVLEGAVTAKGTVEALHVVKVERPGLGFEDAAIEAVRKWRYAPARIGKDKVAVHVTFALGFGAPGRAP